MAMYDRLPPGEQKLADTILPRLNNLASYSATELASDAKVSKATAARFFKRIGYKSFDHARRQARAEAHLASPLYALAGVSSKERVSDALSRHVAADLRNLSETFKAPNIASLNLATTLIANAPRVSVVGMRNGHFVASFAASLLAQLREGVFPLPNAAMSLAEDLVSLVKGDVLLVVDFRRRSALLPKIVDAARQAGTTLVFISGPGMPTLARSGDVVIQCLTDGASLFDSYVAAVSIVNFLCASVARELGKKPRKRLEAIESLHLALGDISH